MFIFQHVQSAHAPTPQTHTPELAHTTPPTQQQQTVAYNTARDNLTNNYGVPRAVMSNDTQTVQQQVAAISAANRNNPEIQAALANYHPVGIRMPEAEARRISESPNGRLYAFTQSNGTIVTTDAMNRLTPAQQVEVVRHEILHDLSFRSRTSNPTNIATTIAAGQSMHTHTLTRSANGRMVETTQREPIPASMEEGATQYMTATMTPNTNGAMAYPNETGTMVMVGHVVGRATLQHAIMSGDFTDVHRSLDAHLGQGTYNNMMARFRNNDPVGANAAIANPLITAGRPNSNNPEMQTALANAVNDPINARIETSS